MRRLSVLDTPGRAASSSKCVATFWCLQRTTTSVFKMLKERVLRCLRWRGLCDQVERSIIAGWCLGKREHAIVERGGGGEVCVVCV
jgi:hypothetical protein